MKILLIYKMIDLKILKIKSPPTIIYEGNKSKRLFVSNLMFLINVKSEFIAFCNQMILT